MTHFFFVYLIAFNFKNYSSFSYFVVVVLIVGYYIKREREKSLFFIFLKTHFINYYYYMAWILKFYTNILKLEIIMCLHFSLILFFFFVYTKRNLLFLIFQKTKKYTEIEWLYFFIIIIILKFISIGFERSMHRLVKK